MGSGLNDPQYMAQRDALKRLRLDCWICEQPIDYDAHYTHKDAFTADHVQARSKGGSLYGELKPAHRGCNSRRGNRGTHITSAPNTAMKW